MRRGAHWRVRLFGHVGQQSDGARALDGGGQLTLMLGAGAHHAAGQDLAALAGEAAKFHDILIIDALNLVYAERANLPARLAATRTAHTIASIFRHVAFLLVHFR